MYLLGSCHIEYIIHFTIDMTHLARIRTINGNLEPIYPFNIQLHALAWDISGRSKNSKPDDNLISIFYSPFIA